MPKEKPGLLTRAARDIRHTMAELFITWLWWAFWGVLIGAALGGGAGFAKFGWTGLLWGLVAGAITGAILSVLAHIVINTGNPFD